MTINLKKSQLYILLSLALVNLIYYFLASSLPDNAFVISSSSESVSTIGYYFSSIFAYTSYYSGVWIVVPSLAYLFLYSFLISKRYNRYDILVPTLLVLLFYFSVFVIMPSSMGSGLYASSIKFLNPYVAIISSFVFICFLFSICLKGAFFTTVKVFMLWLQNASNRMVKNYDFLGTTVKNLFVGFRKKASGDSLKQKMTGLLKTEKEEVDIDQEITERVDIVENIIDKIEKAPIEIKHEVEVTEKKETSSFVPKKTKATKRISSHDLIECISSKGQQSRTINPDTAYFTRITDAIEEKLQEFKLEAKIINILKGPVVDTFELELGSGVKVSKVTGLSDDISLALNGAPIRIVYPMRGKSTIGIEVPRNPREIIYLDEVLKSKAFNSSNHRLPVAMGKDAFGDVSVVDLAAMPHMLVAGATGAGKSVFINTLLVSLIIKLTPRDLKLILIDPKQLELASYQELPHLMLPVITSAKEATIALLWAVQEMERRYSILKDMGVKNIEGFNKKLKTCDKETLYKINKYYEDSSDEGYELPYLVVVIDEFADLILTKSGKEIEDNVNRLAAKARAAGIHLVLATQRPSTDVVTGVVKANFPTRVAFRVTTATDSRVILDQYGAEKLLGKGDMLYKHGVDLSRVHSAFVDEDEVDGLVEMLGSYPKSFNTQAMDFLENGGEDLDDMPGSVRVSMGPSGDDLYDEAVRVVTEAGQASASMLQRRLRVGYNRAANLVEEMERNGIIGPQQGSKPRKVLSSSAE